MSTNTEEGFICPLCLVGFSSSSKLSGHFIEMHSDSYPSRELPSQLPEMTTSYRQGHHFKMIHHSRPKNCDACGEIIWTDSIVCEICGVTLHTDRCEDEYTQRCVPTPTNQGDMEDGGAEDEPRGSGPTQQPRGILPYVRRKVAKRNPFEYPKTVHLPGRERYVKDEFDLDLTYITERIIAMSFPATGMETAYRNNLKDVAKMLRTKHQENYMIFNLSERSYDITNFNNQVLDFGWPDHLAPSLERLSSVCKSIKSWLDSDPQHVAVVHCKGGKGRTGCVIAAFMHYSEICHSAEAALDRFAMKRFYDSKCGGVTQPSQRKYVHYFADLLAGRIDLQSPPVTLQHVIMHGIPNFDGKGGCRPFLKFYENMSLVHTSGLYMCGADKERLKISIYGGLSLKGEVLIKCFHKKTHGMETIFRCQLHSAVVAGQDLRMVYNKNELDEAFKDKRFDEGIRVELIFDNAEDQYPDDVPMADVRSSLLDGKQQTVNNGSANGNVGLEDDLLAKRNSYASFRGGYDSGMPGDDPPDLIDLESPGIKVTPLIIRQRSESEASFKMDPGDIEHFIHPQSSELYTVVQKPVSTKHKPELKAEEKPHVEEKPPPRAHKSSSDISNDSLFSFLDRSDRRDPFLRDSSPSKPSHGAKSSKPPTRPPPPSIIGAKKTPQTQGVNRPLPELPSSKPSGMEATDEDYAEIDDETPITLSPEDVDGPGHFKHVKPVKSSPDLTPQLPTAKPRSHKPQPPAKPTVKPKPHADDKSSALQEEIQKKLLKQHLQKKRESVRQSMTEVSKPKEATATSSEQPRAEKPTKRQVLPHQQSSEEHKAVKPTKKHVLPHQQSSEEHKAVKPTKKQVLPHQHSSEASKPEKPAKKPHLLKHHPSYDEIPLNQEITVQPLPSIASATDSDIWVRVKYPSLTRKADGSLERRSISSGNLTMTSNSGSDYYSNLAELDIVPGSEGESGERKDSVKRSRSFSNHEKVVIKPITTNRDSIIPVNTMTDDEPEYKNLEYAPDGTLLETADPPPPSQPHSTSKEGGASGAGGASDGVKKLPPEVLKARKEMLANLIKTHNYENTELDRGEGNVPSSVDPTDEDYINQLPEGIFHIYSNQDELLEQIRSAHQPVDESLTTPSAEPSTSEAPPSRSRIGSAASFLKFLRLLTASKNKHQTIHSGLVSEEERVKTLAPFEMAGVEIGRVNRDYEAFLRTSAWGSGPVESGEGKPAGQTQAGEESHSRPSDVGRSRPSDVGHGRPSENREAGHSHHGQEHSGRAPPPKPDRPRNLAPPADKEPPVQSKMYRRPIRQSSRENVISPETTPPSAPSPLASRRHPPLAKKPSDPNPPRPHIRLQATNSDAVIVPRSKVKDLIMNQNRHSEVPSVPHRGGGAEPHPHPRPRGPPPKPVPYLDHGPNPLKPSESNVKSLMAYWYQPGWTRDEAIDYIRPLEPGSFIVRDSQTVQGGYALTLKLSEDHVRRRKKLAEDAAITEEMLVTHFLIQPDPEGVKLQGWNERAFKSLPEFIAHHTVDKLCMPCRLVLPRGHTSSSSVQPQARRRPAGMQQALQTGAACNLVWLGSVDVTTPGDDRTVADSVKQLRSLDFNMNIVTFKASREGITLADNVNGMYIKRQYPISSVTYCSLDPNDTRWDFPGIQHAGEVLTLRDKPCFGVVYHPQDSFGYSCLVFAELDSAQPVTSVVNFVQKVMREHKLANRHAQK